VARHRDRLGIPVVLFTYFNPIHARGVERFAEQAAASGVDGVLCVDLPPEEGEGDFIPALREQGVDTVFLLAPTSTRERVSKVGASSTGFVYYVSRTGVTGEQAALATDLARDVKRLRKRLDQPLAVGFGLSTPQQVAAVAEIADGVVVGSTLVRLIEEKAGDPGLPLMLEDRVRDLSAPLRQRSERRRAG
jgi:tryptophan synthase alpha chain